MYLMDSGAGKCTARFFAAGSERETTENEYAQVKKFFTERSHELLEVKHWGEPEEEEQGKLIQRVCRHCGARSHRGEANFCWNCGASITAGEAAVSTRAKTPIVSLNMADGKNLRTCTVCQLGFRQGDLLAWCPFCGGAAHRVHLLEYLHVNGKCPSCSHHLEEEDLAHQFERARLRLPRKPQE
jgi:ribosomal protein L40E